MLGMDKSLQDLKGMLRIVDGEMKKSSSNLMIQEGGSRINKMKRKATPKVALKYKSKGKIISNQNTPKTKISSTSDCFCCQSKGHWKRNCPKYLEVVRTGNVLKNSITDILLLKLTLLPLFMIGYWILYHVFIFVQIWRH
jgi:predicted AAA+ superfamily ATPase